jgi:hypothetical protein
MQISFHHRLSDAATARQRSGGSIGICWVQRLGTAAVIKWLDPEESTASSMPGMSFRDRIEGERPEGRTLRL